MIRGTAPTALVLTPTGLSYRGRRFPVCVGRGGLTSDKREGDGATPRGTHRITGLLYRPDRLLAPASWARPIGPRSLWSDDPVDPAYNTLCHAPHLFSHEVLRRPDPLYDAILLTDWNAGPAIPHRGSAIFLHTWRRPGAPTAGCLALRRAHLLWVAARAAPGTPLLIA